MSDSFSTSWTVARQAPLSVEFFRQEYWSGRILEEPFPSPGDLRDPGNEPRSPELQADSLPTELQGKPQSYDYQRGKVGKRKIRGWD